MPKNAETVKQYKTEADAKIAERKLEKILCECGSTYARAGKARHLQTQVHILACGVFP